MPVDGRVTTSAGMSATIPVPREFLNETIAHIDDATELHVTLAVFRLASDSGTVPPAVSEDAVLRDPVLTRTFHADRRSSMLGQRIRRGLLGRRVDQQGRCDLIHAMLLFSSCQAPVLAGHDGADARRRHCLRKHPAKQHRRRERGRAQNAAPATRPDIAANPAD